MDISIPLEDLLMLPNQTIFIKNGNIDELIHKKLGLKLSPYEKHEIHYKVLIHSKGVTRFKSVSLSALQAFEEEIDQMLYYDPTQLDFTLRVKNLANCFLHLELNKNTNEIVTITEIDEDEDTQELIERVIFSSLEGAEIYLMSDYLCDMLESQIKNLFEK